MLVASAATAPRARTRPVPVEISRTLRGFPSISDLPIGTPVPLAEVSRVFVGGIGAKPAPLQNGAFCWYRLRAARACSGRNTPPSYVGRFPNVNPALDA